VNKKNLLIEISDLNKKFILENNKNIELIKNLSFKLKMNSKVSITGPSGSGKTTLLNIIGLLDSDFDGLYLFKGKNISSYSTFEKNKLRGLSIGFIHQFFHLIPELSVIENVMLPILINRNDNKAYEISKKILFDFGLEDRIDYKPLKLSGGEQQRVAIARSLVNNPDIILADEMTGNLDEETANNIFSFFINYIEQNKKTLVYVTHNKKLTLFADEIYNFTNKKLHLNNE
jgi:ABC-type lipoprotein export system ATPase subunit